MERKIVSETMLVLLLSGMLTLAFNIQPVEASGTIRIMADGSIRPDTAPISTADNITYTFISNITDSIQVKRSNIIIDGAEYTLNDPRIEKYSSGIVVTSYVTNVTIQNINIKGFYLGIHLVHCEYVTVSGNNITNNRGSGIEFSWGADNNLISGNNIVSNKHRGIGFDRSHNNTISGNNIAHPLLEYLYGGIMLNRSNNNRILNNTLVSNGLNGIELESSSNNTIVGNLVSNNEFSAVFLSKSNYNAIHSNELTSNYYYDPGLFEYLGAGIRFLSSNENSISRNIISDNYEGITLRSSNSNRIHHNNFINNERQVYIHPETSDYGNFWDDGYPSGGNYWSDHNGTDYDNDGIGDNPYIIDENNIDNYPLMGMFSVFNATSEYHIQTICNSTISNFQFNSSAISFNVTGESDTTGFCRICIPTALMNDTYRVFVNGTEIQYTLLPFSNSTYSYLYFTYNHSTQEVMIIPEFPTWTLAFLILILLSFVIVIYKRRLLKTPIH